MRTATASRAPKRESAASGFHKRLTQAADTNPAVPPLRSGRLVHIRNELAKLGHEVSAESVRKWFHGETVPRRDYAEGLAKILKADVSWLVLGSDIEEARRRQERQALASGAVNLVAGLMQLDGAAIAFPDEGDRYARAQHADLHAVIRGTMYPVHVATAEERKTGDVFVVPLALRNTVPIGVVQLKGFNYAFYVITDMAIELGRPSTEGWVEVSVRSKELRKIKSFKEPL